MKSTIPEEPELRLLLEDYGKRRALASGQPPQWEPEAFPLRLLLEDYGPRPKPRNAPADIGPAPGAAELRLLAEEFDPVRRYREQAPAGAADLPPLEPGEALDFEVHWDAQGARTLNRTRAASFAFHLSWIVLLVIQPYIDHRSDFTEKQRDQKTTNITLLAPSREEIEALTRSTPDDKGETKIFRGQTDSPMPAVTIPKEQPKPVEKPKPIPAVPIQREEPPPAPTPPQIVEEKPAAQPKEPDKPVEVAAAQTPAPGAFQRGKELAPEPQEKLPPKPPPTKPIQDPKMILQDPFAVTPSEKGPIELAKLGINKRPDQIIESAVEQMQQAGGGRQAVGDGVGAGASGGYSPPAPGNIGSGLELLSDPKGVDFRPYLIQVLNAVRRNWYAVLPESARLGMERGRVAIQFSIDREGGVPKLVIADTSRSQPLDRAAVAGVSASLPFPPLPSEFSGDQIRLQLVFLYNMRQ